MMSNKKKDWTGDAQSVMATLNSSNNTDSIREKNDYYATPPKAVEQLLDLESFQNNIWECACGEGHISKMLIDKGYNVRSSDLIDRGFGDTYNFLDTNGAVHCDIITNPPFSKATEFLEKAMEILFDGNKLVMLLRIQFLEGVKRGELYKKYPPKKVYVASRNMRCAKNGDFENATGNASTYCWFVWEKGFNGKTEIDWFNRD
jgi:hypothetical protein